jgi:hypothetical protein
MLSKINPFSTFDINSSRLPYQAYVGIINLVVFHLIDIVSNYAIDLLRMKKILQPVSLKDRFQNYLHDKTEPYWEGLAIQVENIDRIYSNQFGIRKFNDIDYNDQNTKLNLMEAARLLLLDLPLIAKCALSLDVMSKLGYSSPFHHLVRLIKNLKNNLVTLIKNAEAIHAIMLSSVISYSLNLVSSTIIIKIREENPKQQLNSLNDKVKFFFINKGRSCLSSLEAKVKQIDHCYSHYFKIQTYDEMEIHEGESLQLTELMREIFIRCIAQILINELSIKLISFWGYSYPVGVLMRNLPEIGMTLNKINPEKPNEQGDDHPEAQAD